MRIQVSIIIALFTLGMMIGLPAAGQGRNVKNYIFKSGDVNLEGILVRPDVYGQVPAVVFQQGSGGHSFAGYEEEAWGPHKFYLEDVLLEQGYAVFYCNKRGLGKSEGNWKRNDFYGRADDAYAAVQFLKTLPEIDEHRIGIAGHSQGGWVAQIAAAQHRDIAFVISLAGPTVGVKAQMATFDSLQYLCNGYSGQKLEKKMKRNRKHRNFSAGVGKVLPVVGSARHWYLISDYDHDEVLKGIKCPTLLLFAEYDIIVWPEENIRHFNEVFGDDPPTNFTIKVMPGGQHGFYKVADQCVDWDTAIQQPFDPQFQEAIRQWLTELPLDYAGRQ